MIKKVVNIPASIHTRLLNKAKELNKPFGEILQYYGMERFLFRLSKTTYVNKFILKGGLLFYCWDTPLRRPTKDIDFRGFETNDLTGITEIIRKICSVSVPEDGLSFDNSSLNLTNTQEEADYLGIRARFIFHLGESQIHMQIDIGFYDQIVPAAVGLEFPPMLPNMIATKLKGYPHEAVISEKFQAMIHLGELNSRMKDYYDIWLLSNSYEYDIDILQKAITNTFRNRETEIPEGRPVVFSREFAHDNQKMWEAFLSRNNLNTEKIVNYSNVLDAIWFFLGKPIKGIFEGKSMKGMRWIPGKGWKMP
jgi:predicted nucleotidyltransferase component of viral defense system